jgi:uncharacterized protein (DUF1810 family)
MDDPYTLERYIKAQQPVYEQVCSELRSGRKRSHWMWFIFPQIEGLGHSEMARRYAISSLDEARAYLEHPILGARLRECVALVNAVQGREVEDIFGYPDNLKFHSSITLFSCVAPDEPIFGIALEKYFSGHPDSATLQWLEQTG